MAKKKVNRQAAQLEMAIADLNNQINKMPEGPAKEAAKTKWRQYKSQITDAMKGDMRPSELMSVVEAAKKDLALPEKPAKTPEPKPAKPAPEKPAEALKKAQENLEAGAPAKPETPKPAKGKRAPKPQTFDEVFQPGSKGVYRYVQVAVPDADKNLRVKSTVVRAATEAQANDKAVAWAKSQGVTKKSEVLLYAPEAMGYEVKVEGATGPVRADQMASQMEASLQNLRRTDKNAPDIRTEAQDKAYEKMDEARKKEGKGRRPRKALGKEASDEARAATAGTGKGVFRRPETSQLSAGREYVRGQIRENPEGWESYKDRTAWGKELKAKKEELKALEAQPPSNELSVKKKKVADRITELQIKEEQVIDDLASRVGMDLDGFSERQKATKEAAAAGKAKPPAVYPENLGEGRGALYDRGMNNLKAGNFELAQQNLGAIPTGDVGEVVKKPRGSKGSQGGEVFTKRDYADPKELKDILAKADAKNHKALRVKWLAENGYFDSADGKTAERLKDLVSDSKQWNELSKNKNAIAVLERYGTGSFVARNSINADEFDRVVLTQLDYALERARREGGGAAEYAKNILYMEGELKNSRSNPFTSGGRLKKEYLGGAGAERKQSMISRTVTRAGRKAEMAAIEGLTFDQAEKRYLAAATELANAEEKGVSGSGLEKIKNRMFGAQRKMMLVAERDKISMERMNQGLGTEIIQQFFEKNKLMESLEDMPDGPEKTAVLKRIEELEKTQISGVIARKRGGYGEKTNAQLRGALKEAKAELAAATSKNPKRYVRGGNNLPVDAETAKGLAESARRRITEIEQVMGQRSKDPAKAAVEAAARKATTAAAPVATATSGGAMGTIKDVLGETSAPVRPMGPDLPPGGLKAAEAGAEAAGATGKGLKELAKKGAGGFMRVLVPLLGIYGAYEVLSALRGRTVGDEDERRLKTLQALGAVSGGTEQDLMSREQIRTMQRQIDMAGVQRQQALDEMRQQYTGNQAIDAILRSQQASLSSIAAPSRPGISEMFARM